MSSDLATLADAIVSALNAPPAFTPALVAVRRALPVLDLASMGEGVHVTVVPKSVTPAPGARGFGAADLAVDIGVQRRVNPDSLAEVDAMLALVEAIARRLYAAALPGLPGVLPTTIDNDPAIAPDHLDRFQVFTSVLTATYRVARQ